MKPYMVEIKVFGVVMAEDESHARSVAGNFGYDIFKDDYCPTIEVEGEATNLGVLRRGWDGECIPYNGNGHTTLADLLES